MEGNKEFAWEKMYSRKRRVKKGGSDTCLTSFGKSNTDYTRLFKRPGGVVKRMIHSEK